MHDQGAVTAITTPMPAAPMTEHSHAADVVRLALTQASRSSAAQVAGPTLSSCPTTGRSQELS
jgi:hypothetical protein